MELGAIIMHKWYRKIHSGCHIIKLWWWWFFSQGFGQIKQAFRAPTNDDILKPYISDPSFRSININAAGEAANDIVYSLYVLDTRYQKVLEAAQPIRV